MKNLWNYIKQFWNEPDNSEGSSRVRMNQTHHAQKPDRVENMEPSYTSKMISQNRFDKLGYESYKQLNDDYLQLLNHHNKTI